VDNLGTTPTSCGQPGDNVLQLRVASRRVSDPAPTLGSVPGPVIAAPLPECELCETPTRRATHDRNGGLCNDCIQGIWKAAALLPPQVPDAR
jgi:hypothetical protein